MSQPTAKQVSHVLSATGRTGNQPSVIEYRSGWIDGKMRINVIAANGNVTEKHVLTVDEARDHYRKHLREGFYAVKETPVPASVKTVVPAKPAKEEFNAADLDHFTGSEIFTPINPVFGRNHLMTDGVRHVAEKCGAYWLPEAILSHQPAAVKKDVRLRDFQVWYLRKNPKNETGAILSCWADSGRGEKAKLVQKIEFTDFPLSAFDANGFRLYACRNEFGGMTIMLPSEY
jgi:hypothetical protein